MRASSRRLQQLKMNVVIANRQRTKKINARLLKQIVGGLFAELKITEAELGINLVAAPEMTLVNETFLQHEGSTDVITFDHSGNGLPVSGRQNKSELPAGCWKHVHGELFVCVDEAILQARRFKTDWQTEVVRYIVHGVLHLLGHDDRRAAARRKMKREENRLVCVLVKRFTLAQLARAAKLGA
ncbi:MAG: rRNA maturation RNase YbeY [Verrucomicrobiota bacterium]